MAGGLVPHQLPDGRVIQVPDYLVPQGMRLPDATAPVEVSAPDLRVAGPGGGPMAQWGNEIPTFEATAPVGQIDQVANIRNALSPKGPTEHATKQEPSKFKTLGLGKSPASNKADPASLDIPGRAPAQQTPSGGGPEMDPLLRRVFNEGGRGGPARPAGLQASQVVEERQPGKEMLPELKWRYGLEERPDFGQELDPTAEQPTWGDGAPITRARKTGLERGADQAGAAGQQVFQREELMRQQQAVAQKDALLQQSEALDGHLQAIAEKRSQVAQLQALAEQRAQDAASVEPRTRAQIWADKGQFAQGLGILGMVFSAAAQGLRGGPNAATEILNKWIGDAVEDDRYRYERAEKLGINAKNDFQRAMAAYGDLDLATLDVRQRKTASTLALAQQMLADKALDDTAKQRGAVMVQQLQEQYLQQAQALQDMVADKVLKQQVTLKPVATGGGGPVYDTLQRIERTARAKKGMDTITGADDRKDPTHEIQGEKLDQISAALNTLDAADTITRELNTLGNDSDWDDPASGPIDRAAEVLGTGTKSRQSRQSLARATQKLARGLQQSLGKSDNDAKLADQMAIADGSGKGRRAAAEQAKRESIGRLQTMIAGLTPNQQQSLWKSLPESRRAQLQDAFTAVSGTRRSKNEEPDQ